MDRRAAADLVDRYWQDLLRTDPMIGTLIGDERYDDRLPDPSPNGLAARETLHRGALEELALVDRDLPDVGVRTALDVLEAIAMRELAEIGHRLDRLQVASHFWGPTQLLAELGAMQRADTRERLERYLARLRATREYYAAVSDVAMDGIAAGVTAPRVVAERTLAQLERLLGMGPEDSPALLPVPESDAEGRARVAEHAVDRGRTRVADIRPGRAAGTRPLAASLLTTHPRRLAHADLPLASPTV